MSPADFAAIGWPGKLAPWFERTRFCFVHGVELGLVLELVLGFVHRVGQEVVQNSTVWLAVLRVRVHFL